MILKDFVLIFFRSLWNPIDYRRPNSFKCVKKNYRIKLEEINSLYLFYLFKDKIYLVD